MPEYLTRKIGAIVMPVFLSLYSSHPYILFGHNKEKSACELPGGKLESTDKSILLGALRELNEETGIDFLQKPQLHSLIQPVGVIDLNDSHLVMLYTVVVPGSSFPDIDAQFDDGLNYEADAITRIPHIANPEAHKYHEWIWCRSDELPSTITWFTGEVLKKLDIKIDKTKTYIQMNEYGGPLEL
jgi:8-oxo-dGTP pyrophosphatase MutT (NUDIX family)